MSGFGGSRLGRLIGGAGLAAAGFITVSVLGADGAGAEELPTWAPPQLEVPMADPDAFWRHRAALDAAPAASAEPTAPAPPPAAAPAPAAPPASASRRVVYSNSKQRVWLYEGDAVVHSYAVSGRRGVPRPGSYSVFSKSPVAYSGKVSMRWMVRFARGSRLAIGFHAIPVGARGPIQSIGQLGQFRSAGCVRQAPGDAERMWNFAHIGTRVVVTA